MIEGLTFNKIKDNGWDATSEYEVAFADYLTVGDLVSKVIKCNNSWGYIGIKPSDPNAEVSQRIFGYPCIEYQYGDIITANNLARFSDRVIKRIHASGGWSRMDYLIDVYEESEDE